MVEPILRNKDEVSCSRTEHRAPRMYLERTVCRYWIEVIQHVVPLATMCKKDMDCFVSLFGLMLYVHGQQLRSNMDCIVLVRMLYY